MKKSAVLIMLAILLTAEGISQTSQTSQTINYQAVARDGSGTVISNQPISVRFTIIKDGPAGQELYTEKHTVTTNKFGLFTLGIGQGEPVFGSFSLIDWSSGNMFLKVEMDESGGTNFQLIGVNKFNAVPFSFRAFVADKVDAENASYDNNASGMNADNVQTALDEVDRRIDVIELGDLIKKITDAADLNYDNSISGLDGTNVQDAIDELDSLIDLDGDNSTSNEIQTLTKSGSTISLSLGGGSVVLNDDDSTNEIQNASTVDYDNTISGLTATSVQAAIDELHYNAGNTVKMLNDLGDAKTDLSSIFIGSGAGAYTNNKVGNTALGDSALNKNCSIITMDFEAINNTAIGSKALYSNAFGWSNTAIGGNALYSNFMGQYNTANGYNSLYSNTNGSNNSATGYQALKNNTTGGNNTAAGSSALMYNVSGSYNQAFGVSALSGNQSGSNNTAMGAIALLSNTTGSNNTATGYYALLRNTSGSNNTAMGFNSGANLLSGDNNVFLGSNAGPASFTSLNNTLWIASSQGTPTIYADLSGKNVGLGNTAPTNRLHITAAADPLRLEGLVTDNTLTDVLFVDANGVVHKGSIGDADSDSTNEIQTISLSGSDLTLSKSGGTVSINDADHDSTNEIQTLSLSGSDLTLSKSGGTISINDADHDSTNEIQNAAQVDYDNSTSGLSATSVQAAIDELGAAADSAVKVLNDLGDAKTEMSSLFIGRGAGDYNNGKQENTAVGDYALYNNGNGAVGSEQAKYNTAVGSKAMLYNTTGSGNTANGYNALNYNTAGSNNTATGKNAMYKNTTGSDNSCTAPAGIKQKVSKLIVKNKRIFF